MTHTSVYAFVCIIGSVVATITFLLWVFVPTQLMHDYGMTNIPSKNLALIVPSYCIVLLSVAVWLYLSTNLWRTRQPEDKSTVFDGFTVPASKEFIQISEQKGIPNFGDIDPVYASQCLFPVKSSKE